MSDRKCSNTILDTTHRHRHQTYAATDWHTSHCPLHLCINGYVYYHTYVTCYRGRKVAMNESLMDQCTTDPNHYF